MRHQTPRLARISALSLASLTLWLILCPAPCQGETARLEDRLSVDSLIDSLPIANRLRNGEATGSSVSEVATGTEAVAESETISKVKITEDTEIVRNQTGKVKETEDTKATSEKKTKSVGKGAQATAGMRSIVTTKARVTSRHSSTRMVHLPEAVNKTEAEVEKKIEAALSGAIFEASTGTDVTIATTRTVDVITSAYADLMVAAGTTAESEDGEEVCSEVVTKVAPLAVTASIKTALEDAIGSDLPPTVQMDLRKLEQASISLEGSSDARTCAELGKSDAQSILTSSSYQQTVSSIVEDIIIVAKDNVVTKKSKVDVDTETSAESVEVYTESEAISAGKSSSSADVEATISAETVMFGTKEKTKTHETSEREQTTVKGKEQGKETVTHKAKAKETKTAESEREVIATKHTTKPGGEKPRTESFAAHEKAKSVQTKETASEHVSTRAEPSKPAAKQEPKSAEPSAKTEAKSAEPAAKQEPKSAEPSAKTEPKSAEPAAKQEPKSAEPAAETEAKSQIPQHETTKDIEEILSSFGESTIGKRGKAKEAKVHRKRGKRAKTTGHEEAAAERSQEPTPKFDEILATAFESATAKRKKHKGGKRRHTKSPSTPSAPSSPVGHRSTQDIDEVLAKLEPTQSPSPIPHMQKEVQEHSVPVPVPHTKTRADLEGVMTELQERASSPPSSPSTESSETGTETPSEPLSTVDEKALLEDFRIANECTRTEIVKCCHRKQLRCVFVGREDETRTGKLMSAHGMLFYQVYSATTAENRCRCP